MKLPALKTVFISLMLHSYVTGGEGYNLSFEWQKEVASKSNKTVHDYFHLLPDAFFDPEGISDLYESVQSRDSLITILDLSNGYIRFEGTNEITLYKDRKNNRDIIALQVGKYCHACNSPEGNRILKFDTTMNRWVPMESLLPDNFDRYGRYNTNSDIERFPYFDLPQHGTSILIRDEETETILDTLYWNGSSFFLKE